MVFGSVLTAAELEFPRTSSWSMVSVRFGTPLFISIYQKMIPLLSK